LLAFQVNTVLYFKGSSDPNSRHLPVLHMAIWEGIKMAKRLGFDFFDLWGYNHFAKENDQVFFINRFKKGFGGEYIFYPKKIYFIYKPLRYKLLQLLKKVKNKFNS
jgi:lipid II:glycine glycyltransferase (peptidoglycan interpeptide bridge formation enzyme)